MGWDQWKKVEGDEGLGEKSSPEKMKRDPWLIGEPLLLPPLSDEEEDQDLLSPRY